MNFIAGLPRSGSTLLCNLLMQNPRFYASETSGLVDILALIRNSWDKFPEMKAISNEVSEFRKKAVCRAIIENYYSDINREIVFDKSRNWLNYVEFIEEILDRKIKILVVVRNIREILASFEKIYRQTGKTRQPKEEQQNLVKCQMVEQRCALWASSDGIVGVPYNIIKSALQRDLADRMFFVKFEELTGNPKFTMSQIYDFLQENYFQHDFDNVEQITVEDDTVYGYPKDSLHKIRTRVEQILPQYPKILGDAADLYKGQELW